MAWLLLQSTYQFSAPVPPPLDCRVWSAGLPPWLQGGLPCLQLAFGICAWNSLVTTAKFHLGWLWKQYCTKSDHFKLLNRGWHHTETFTMNAPSWGFVHSAVLWSLSKCWTPPKGQALSGASRCKGKESKYKPPPPQAWRFCELGKALRLQLLLGIFSLLSAGT